MIKVMIVDDNELIRKSLISSVNWEKLGCIVVEEANDGLSALKKAQKICPDIILMDIKMPGLSGLDVAEKLKKSSPQIKVIIITGYDDFIYAKKGIQIGIFDFILKPIQNKELIKIVSLAITKIRQEHKENEIRQDLLEKQSDIQQMMLNSASELRKKYILDCINGLYPSLESEKIYFPEMKSIKNFSVCVIKPEKTFEDTRIMDSTEINCFIQNIMESIKNVYNVKIIDLWKDYCFTLVVFFKDVCMIREYDLRMLALANHILKSYLESYQQKCVIGISNVYKGFENIKKAFVEADFAMNSRFFIENKYVIHAGTIKSKSIINEYPIMKKIGNLYLSVKNREDSTMLLLDEIFELIKENEVYNVGYMRSLLINICITVNRIVVENDIYAEQVIKNSNEILNDIQKIESRSEAFQYVRDYILSISVEIDKVNTVAYSGTTKAILEYLNLNYSKKIALQDVADLVGLSSSHVCRILKKETGESFTGLLNKIRIIVAIRLLSESSLKVYEVANHIGIDNYAYFYQLFKKETGVSPTDFNKNS